VLNSEGPRITGEKHLVDNILKKLDINIVFDVGSNMGGYAGNIKKSFPEAKIYAFEPNPVLFRKLKRSLKDENVKIVNVGFSDKKKKAKLWDFANDARLKHTQPTSTLSSVYKDVIVKHHKQRAKSYSINLETIDEFTEKEKIDNIDLLKIDTEGSEYEILKGAKKLLSQNRIKIIQFEFNEMNVYSRVFFKDFLELLDNYMLFRLMPNGLFPVEDYQPKLHEIFAFQNIIAFNRKSFNIKDFI